MAKRYAQIVGVLVFAAGLAGLFGDGQWLNVINIDLGSDLIRLAVGAALLIVGFGAVEEYLVRGVVGFVGGAFVLLGVLAMFSGELFGLLPHSLTVFDSAFHMLCGVLGVALATLPENRHMAHPA